MQSIKLVICLFVTLGLIFSCKKDEKIESEVSFEKKDILINLADNWILPAYQNFELKLNLLITNWESFKAKKDLSEFFNVQDAWKESYLSFQNVKFIDFGPAMANGFTGSLGTFPSDTNVIENNIASGSYDLTVVSNISAIGLPALDYLLFQKDALANNQNESNRRKYIDDLLSKMKEETDYVISNWTSYRSTFIEGTGTSSTSPFSMLVNAFVKDFEIAKSSKIGIPLGKQSLGIQRPEYLEARYSKFGKELLIQNIKALKSVYLGNSFLGNSGVGFDDYLISLEKQSLSSTIGTRFNFLISDPQGWASDLEDMILNSNLIVDNYYTYIHNSVVYIKTDMTSAFGILITYQDNDGD